MSKCYIEGIVEKMEVTLPSKNQPVAIWLKPDSVFLIKDKNDKKKFLFLSDVGNVAQLSDSTTDDLLYKFTIPTDANLFLIAKNNRNKIRVYVGEPADGSKVSKIEFL